MDIRVGSPALLGSSPTEKGVNFALASSHAACIYLHIYKNKGQEALHKFPLNRSGDIWHVEIEGLPESFEYTYSCEGPYLPKKGHLYNVEKELIDPYAKELNAREIWGDRGEEPPRARFKTANSFDWGTDARPMIPEEDLVIYEMHVRSFTNHPSSKVSHPGTFQGIEEKIPYLKELGVNAIELMPIHEFDELAGKTEDGVNKPPNYWGYSTAHFFCPMRRYGSGEDLKKLVKKLHEHGIEIILDVVYNHTSEGSDIHDYYSFRGIDNKLYYLIDEHGYMNFSGCGNTLKCQHPLVQELILDSLRYWVTEFHIDGFRFDLASILSRDQKGHPLKRPPLIQKITRDPILGPTKLIAEPWDAGGLYQVGSFPSWKFSEWNGKYRDSVRRFIKGTGSSDEMKMCLLGSPDLYGHKGSPFKSINFVTAHDGFTLRDLVSYNQKHNEENGEDSRDGNDHNESWNCGEEGETKDPGITALRERQMRNLLLALFISQGTPMLLMGDEYGHTRKGNNNTWCHDNDLNYFLWDKLEKNHSLFQFTQKLIRFRQEHDILKQKKFLSQDEMNWEENDGFLGLTLRDEIFAAFNPRPDPYTINKEGWYRIVDTAKKSPEDFLDAPQQVSDFYELAPYSAAVFSKVVSNARVL